MFMPLACMQDSVRASINLRVQYRELTISVDHQFEDWQEREIAEALSEWVEASDSSIHFKILWKQPKPGLYRNFTKPNSKTGIFLWLVDKTDTKTLTPELIEHFSDIEGLYVPGTDRSANILIFNQTPTSKFKSVVLHEFGHLLGLEHFDSFGYIMSTNASSSCLTLKDTTALCSYYRCMPKSQCLFCEPDN
jgi:hypothetical protein